MRGRSRGQSMVLLAAARQSDGQPRMQTTLHLNTDCLEQMRQAPAPAQQSLPDDQTGPSNAGHHQPAAATPASRLDQSAANPEAHPSADRNEMTHEERVAAFDAKQRAFAAQNQHDFTAMTLPDSTDSLLSAHHQMQPHPQRQRQTSNSQEQKARLSASSTVRCIMPGTLLSLAQAARVEPRRSGQPLRCPAGPSALGKHRCVPLSCSGADAPMGQPLHHHKRQRTHSAPQIWHQRHQLQAMKGPSLQRSAARLLQGLHSDSRRDSHSQLHSFFARRSRELRASGCRTKRIQREPSTQPLVGLLALPQDVLLLVVCKLEHREIGALFSVCRELRATMDTAMMMHFNVQTPHQAPEGTGSEKANQLPLRPAKRVCTISEEAEASEQTSLDRPSRDAPAARALLFDDSALTGDSASEAGYADEVNSSCCGQQCEPLVPISLA